MLMGLMRLKWRKSVALRVASMTCAVAVAASLGPAPSVAHADAGGEIRVVSARAVTDTRFVLDVYSPSMDRVVSNEILRPRGGGSAPTLYLLNGALGNEDGVGWLNNSSVIDFFADKDVTVVLPIGGRFSFYTDWQTPDPVLGNNKWQTYLSRELPVAIEREYGSTGRNAVAGVSMSGGPALDLAIHAPDVFDAAASLSGCPAPSNPFATAGISAMIAGGMNNPFNMWGLPGSAGWHEHDPSLNVERLRGTAVYVSASSGNPGPIDRIPVGAIPPVGGAIVEAMVNYCTSLFVDALHRANVPATISMREQGAHTWPLFESQLRQAWATTLAPALGTA